METTKNKREEEDKKFNVALEAGYEEIRCWAEGCEKGCEGAEIFAIREQGLRGAVIGRSK